MFSDDFTKSASEKISGDGFSGLFGSDEAKTTVKSDLSLKFPKNEIFTGSRFPPVTNDLKLAPLAHSPFPGQSHDWKKIPM